ncbi:hypothetical protein TNCV_2378241 [Trichonephila clavipes]|nr:hypothetical protein TNCV_2378241 [Trichonephila clavipes]
MDPNDTGKNNKKIPARPLERRRHPHDRWALSVKQAFMNDGYTTVTCPFILDAFLLATTLVSAIVICTLLGTTVCFHTVPQVGDPQGVPPQNWREITLSPASGSKLQLKTCVNVALCSDAFREP